MDAVPEGKSETVGIVDRLVGCLQPVLTILGKADPKLQKPGILNTLCSFEIVHNNKFIILRWGGSSVHAVC